MSETEIPPSTLKNLVKITLGSNLEIKMSADKLSSFSKPFISFLTMTELANRGFGGTKSNHQLYKVRIVLTLKLYFICLNVSIMTDVMLHDIWPGCIV